jgi:hypothetical protein
MRTTVLTVLLIALLAGCGDGTSADDGTREVQTAAVFMPTAIPTPTARPLTIGCPMPVYGWQCDRGPSGVSGTFD